MIIPSLAALIGVGGYLLGNWYRRRPNMATLTVIRQTLEMWQDLHKQQGISERNVFTAIGLLLASIPRDARAFVAEIERREQLDRAREQFQKQEETGDEVREH